MSGELLGIIGLACGLIFLLLLVLGICGAAKHGDDEWARALSEGEIELSMVPERSGLIVAADQRPPVNRRPLMTVTNTTKEKHASDAH
jgi:hypothetical protein